jgi:hypothetical protein
VGESENKSKSQAFATLNMFKDYGHGWNFSLNCGCFLKCFFVLKYIKIIYIFYFLKIIFKINVSKW